MSTIDNDRKPNAAVRHSLTSLPCLQQEMFQNPANIVGSFINTHPDPYVLKHRGQYYSYATHPGGVTVLHSKDLISWTSHGYAFQMEGQQQYWAPSVVYENGLFYMYVSCYPITEEDAHFGTMKVAVSASPLGPFEYKKTFFDTFSIDSHVVKDEAGRYYLFYSNNEYSGTDPYRPGTVILVDRLLDMMTLEHRPKLVVEPSIEEEIFAVDRFGDGRDWHTIEGAFYFRRNGKHFVIYSGNAFGSPTYFLGLSSAEKQSGQEDLRELTWDKTPSGKTYRPLLQQNEQVEGAGHNSMVVGPNLIEEWVVYHGRAMKPAIKEAASEAHVTMAAKEGNESIESIESGEANAEKRQMRLDRMLWQGDQPWIAGPSSEEQDAPMSASFIDHFDHEIGAAESEWIQSDGDWEAGAGELKQTNVSCVGIILTAQSYEHYVAELSLRAIDNHAGARYGFYAAYQNAHNYGVIVLDKGRSTIEAYAVRGGIKLESEVQALPQGFNSKVYHELRVEKTGRQVSIYLDGVFALSRDIAFLGGQVGFFTQYSMAAFSGFALTRYAKLDEHNADAFAELLKQASLSRISMQEQAVDAMPQWTFERGWLRHRNPKNQPSVMLLDKGLTAGNCQIRMDWRLDHERKSGMLGFYPCYVDEYNGIAFLYERDGHLLKQVKTAHGRSETVQTIDLPETFDPMDEHCFWMKRVDGQALVLLDQIVLFHGEMDRGTIGWMVSGEATLRNIEIIY